MGLVSAAVAAYLMAMLPGALAALALFLCLRFRRRRRLQAKRLKSPLLRECALGALWMFSGGMAAVTLTPRWMVRSLAELVRGHGWNAGGYSFFGRGSVSLIPFKTLRFEPYILVGNVVMFLPFGFFAAMLWRGWTWKQALALGLCITGVIECWQLCVGRTFDIDDIMLNTLGVLGGYWLWRGLDRLLPRGLRGLHCIESGNQHA